MILWDGPGPKPVPQWTVHLLCLDNGREYVVNVYAPDEPLAIRRAVGQTIRDHGGRQYTLLKARLWDEIAN